MRNESYPTLAYALGLAALGIVGGVVMVELKWRFLDWLWNEHSFWAPVIIIFAIAMLPWRVARYYKRLNDHRIPDNAKDLKPKGDGESDSSSFW